MRISAIILILIVIGSFAMVSFIQPPTQKIGEPWNIPAEFKNKRNPHADDASLLRLGRNAYTRHCRSCHGRIGQGDGPMANQMKTFAGDFTKKAWQDKYNDGEIYYMSFIGRDEMPNFESLIPDEEERWAIVNFLRTLQQ
jgi:mono/diheme cytochrome c family protein